MRSLLSQPRCINQVKSHFRDFREDVPEINKSALIYTVRPRKNETENYRCFYHNLITTIINK